MEVHHVRKLKDLRGKQEWERQMIRRHRKTMVLCIGCHHKLHAGKLTEANRSRENGRAGCSGKLPVRFGGEGSETWRSNALRRTALTLLSLGAKPPMSVPPQAVEFSLRAWRAPKQKKPAGLTPTGLGPEPQPRTKKGTPP